MRDSNFWEYQGKLEPMPGTHISNVVPEAIRLAKDGPFTFEFNGVTVIVRHDSNPTLILRDWQRALSGKIESPVGPYPSRELTDAEKAHDAEIEAKNEARRAAAQSEYVKKCQASVL